MDKERSGPSAWTIAAGVFLGLTMLKACSVFSEAALQKAAIEQYNAQISELRRDQERARRTVELDASRRQQIEEIQALRREQLRALSPNERCIDHRRLRRLSNGWEQSGSC